MPRSQTGHSDPVAGAWQTPGTDLSFRRVLGVMNTPSSLLAAAVSTVMVTTLGISLADHATGGRGARVVAVDEGSLGAEAGIEPGDVVTLVNGGTVTSARALRDALADLQPDAWISLSFSGPTGDFRSAVLSLEGRG